MYPRSYASTISIIVCLLSAGYLVFAFASPAARRRRKSRRDYQAIAGDGGGGGATTTGPHQGTGSRAVPVTGVGGAQAQTGGLSLNQGPLGGSVDGVLGRGWRAYGSTDEAPAGAGCLPPASSR